MYDLLLALNFKLQVAALNQKVKAQNFVSVLKYISHVKQGSQKSWETGEILLSFPMLSNYSEHIFSSIVILLSASVIMLLQKLIYNK